MADMQPGTTESFKALVAADPKLREEWEVLTAALISEAKQKGVALTPENLAELTEVRLALTTSDHSFLSGWWDSAQRLLPQVRESARIRELHENLNGDGTSEQQEEAINYYANLKPHERLAAARKTAGATTPATKTPAIELTPEQRAEKLRELDRYPVSMRLDVGRKLGLIQ